MNAEIVTYYSRVPHEPYYRPDCMLESLQRFAEKPVNLGSDGFWQGLCTKSIRLRDWLRRGDNTSDRIIFADAFDVLFLQHPHGIGDRCAEWFGEDTVVFNGERGIWPCADLADDFPDTGPWRYLNSGFICGKAEHILTLLESMDLDAVGLDRKNPDGSWHYPNDQAEFQKAFGKQVVPMVVDGQCRLAMTMHGVTRGEDFEIRDRVLYNLKTGTTPMVAHFNGSGFNDHHEAFREHWQFAHEKRHIAL